MHNISLLNSVSHTLKDISSLCKEVLGEEVYKKIQEQKDYYWWNLDRDFFLDERLGNESERGSKVSRMGKFN